MIGIAFIAGTHGNFLEFVLNKMLYGDIIDMTSPLSTTGLGTSHAQRHNVNYMSHQYFKCHAWPRAKNELDKYNNIINIDFDEDDLLTVIQLNLKRGEDYNINPDTLTNNTYFQLFDKFGPDGKDGNGPDKILRCIQQYSEIDSYRNIKANSWPDIDSVEEFYNLPKHIINESINVFGVEPLLLNEHHPNCPKYILRDIFKTWFVSGTFYRSMQEFNTLYKKTKQIYSINLRTLYDKDLFVQELKNIENFFNKKFDYNILNFHQEFVDRVPYRESLNCCKRIIDSIENKENFLININVIEEAYINYILESKYNIRTNFLQKEFFKTTKELRSYINSN